MTTFQETLLSLLLGVTIGVIIMYLLDQWYIDYHFETTGIELKSIFVEMYNDVKN